MLAKFSSNKTRQKGQYIQHRLRLFWHQYCLHSCCIDTACNHYCLLLSDSDINTRYNFIYFCFPVLDHWASAIICIREASKIEWFPAVYLQQHSCCITSNYLHFEALWPLLSLTQLLRRNSWNGWDYSIVLSIFKQD